jgi:formylglycine-generating enzyme required for sulfatase activity
VHISYFEANAFANWRKLRLPTEQELEVFLNQAPLATGFSDTALLHPNNTHNVYGEVWCWTSSQYSAYPRFKAFDGILNEYNGKFMCNQFVLRGGCVATPDQHYRHSYRNFYQPQQRWMFSGIRLAKDIV